MSGAIGATFKRLRNENQKAFIPFITAGDPDLETTIRLVPELARSGADIVELGIPFSDPVADGPTIQRASERALAHRYRLSDYLAALRALRRETPIPVVLFTYFNPILQYGLEKLACDAAASGVDGILVTDLTPEEAEEYCGCLARHGLAPIFLAAPTSTDARVAIICRSARGFVYVVARAGVTGAQSALSGAMAPTIERVRRHTSLPIAVGFGISLPEQVRAVWEIADGAVVGSAIVARMEEERHSPELVSRIGAYCRWLTGRQG
jgi:tryptophan synthase alpha chain